jgi:hypothetical protein
MNLKSGLTQPDPMRPLDKRICEGGCQGTPAIRIRGFVCVKTFAAFDAFRHRPIIVKATVGSNDDENAMDIAISLLKDGCRAQ